MKMMQEDDKLSMNQSLKMTSSVLTTFPSKLYYVLEYMSDSANPSIAWGPNGDSFRVLLKKEFIQEIIPRYFKQNKYSSFTRQLNIYGFIRIDCGIEEGAYYHPKFLRGKKGLLQEIKRIPLKSLDAVEKRRSSMVRSPSTSSLSSDSSTSSSSAVDPMVDEYHRWLYYQPTTSHSIVALPNSSASSADSSPFPTFYLPPSSISMTNPMTMMMNPSLSYYSSSSLLSFPSSSIPSSFPPSSSSSSSCSSSSSSSSSASSLTDEELDSFLHFFENHENLPLEYALDF